MTHVIAHLRGGVEDNRCIEVCPVEATFFEDDPPEQWDAFMPTNAACFTR